MKPKLVVPSSLKGISKAKLRDSYFMRDLSVAYLDSQRISTHDLAKRVKKALRLDFDPRQMIINSIGLWIGPSREQVQCYRTDKDLLYILRGDYDNKTVRK